MEIKICVGSSCHIKGSSEIVEMMTKSIEKHGLENEISLSGSFCMGVCNRYGVSVQVDGQVHTGITPEGFEMFFNENVLSAFK